MLHDVDPVYAKNINKNDDIRITRGLEVYKLTGKRLSKILSEETKDGDRLSLL